MDSQTEQALKNLLTENASAVEIDLLKEKLFAGQISIGGNVSQSVIILGNGNAVQLTPQALDTLNGRSLLGNLERDLNGLEIETGLTQLAELLPDRGPILKNEFEKLSRRIRPTLNTDLRALSSEALAERTGNLARLNSLCLEITEISFNALCIGVKPPTYDARSPFRGLESFRPEDAEFFFGREELTQKLAQKLNQHNFLAVLGASGSGKSSLVMAGLIPALNVPYAIFRPGLEPLTNLENALEGNPSLLVIDQFEELFTLSAQKQHSEFIPRFLEKTRQIKIVITLRADFLGEVAPFKLLKDEVENHQVIVPPMDDAELRQAMEAQANYTGLCFESDLSQQILDDVSGEPGAMPLLQHALWTLWTRRHGRWLRAEEYRAFGGVKQAIASTADAVYEHCTEFERERLRDIFLRLTRLDEGTDRRDIRRRVLLSDLVPVDGDPESTKSLIKQLADARLVVVSSVGQEAGAQTEVDVAHEALIRHWKRLHTWLNDDRDNLRLREGVTDDARRWENAGRDELLLKHRGPHLELALAMGKNPRYRLNPVEQAYLDECVGLREREAQQKREQEQRENLLKADKLQAELEKARSELLAQQKITKRNITLILFLLIISILLAYPVIYGAVLRQQARNSVETELISSLPSNLGNAENFSNHWAIKPGIYQSPTFRIEKYEVTNARYLLCILAGQCSPPNEPIQSYKDKELPNRPIANISFNQAYQFCEWIGRRLPSDAEWERAARYDGTRLWPWKGNPKISAELAVLDYSGECLPKRNCAVQDVGTAKLGFSAEEHVYDLIGNVAEWTCTPFDSSNPEECWKDDLGSLYPLKMSVRGFSAKTPIEAANAYGAYYREEVTPSFTNSFIGFRCVENGIP